MISRRLSLAAALATTFTLALVQAAPRQDATLRYRWNKGDVLRYMVTQENNVTMSGTPMGDMNGASTMTQSHEYTVADVAADGTGTVRVKFASIKMGVNSPMGSIVWDSASPNAGGDPMSQMIAQSMSPLVGQTITLVISPTGAVTKIDGLGPIMEKINAGMASSPMGQMPGMGGAITEESLRGMFEQSFTQLPERPIKTGESWTKDNTVKMPFGVVNSTAKLALQGVSNGIATITYSATNKVTVDNSKAAAQGMNVTMGDGASDGQLLFDVKAGRVQKLTINGTQPMSMNMGGQSMGATTKTQTTIELLK